MASRWDYLFEAKPIPLLDHLKEEVAKLLAADLSGWPPPLLEVDPDFAQKHQDVLGPKAVRPSPLLFREAFRLAQWDLDRDFDAFDDYLRNARFVERGLGPADRPALLFLQRWLTEQMLSLGEATCGRVKRRDMKDILSRLERRLGLTSLIH